MDSHARARRSGYTCATVRVASLPFLFLLLAACGSEPVGVEENAATSVCRPPADLLASIDVVHVDASALRPALAYAAGVTPSLGSSAAVEALRRSLMALGRTFGVSSDADCREVVNAWSSLRAITVHPEALPDRDTITLVLAMAARAIAAVQPP